MPVPGGFRPEEPVTIPSEVVPVLARLLLLPTMLLGAGYSIWGLREWWGILLGVVIIAMAVVGVVLVVQELSTAGRAYRFFAEGLSYRGAPIVPWADILGAEVHVDNGGESRRRVVRLWLTPDGFDRYLNRPDTSAQRDPAEPDPSMNVSKMRGRSKAETARVLNEAITVNRHRLGLPPIR